MRYLIIMFTLMLLLPSAGLAGDYDLIRDESYVQFSATHAGNEFTGHFTDWSADITFDADDLSNSQLSAEFRLESAKTGNKMYDGTLPKSDWFDIKNHPTATYAADQITKNSDGGYTANGKLTLRGITHDLPVDFTIDDLSIDPVVANGTAVIDRLAYNIGKESDPNAEWVSQDILVDIRVKASKSTNKGQ